MIASKINEDVNLNTCILSMILMPDKELAH